MKYSTLCTCIVAGLSALFTPLAWSQDLSVDSTGAAIITLTNGADELRVDGGLGGAIWIFLNGEIHEFNGVASITINARRGSDNIVIANAGIAGDVEVRAVGSEPDTVSVTGNIDGNLTVVTNGGADQVQLGTDIASLTIGGSTTVRTGAGADDVAVNNLEANGILAVFTGFGDDVLTVKEANLDFLNGTTLNNTVRIGTGSGADRVTMEGITVDGKLRLATNGGDDVVVLEENLFNSHVRVNLGGNNDELTSRANLINGRTQFLGSFGNMDLLITDDLIAPNTRILDFEFFDTPTTETVFALAYTNVDGVEGFDESAGDVLIARWVDGPESGPDGVVGAGDIVETNAFPFGFNAAANGIFVAATTTRHVISTTIDARPSRVAGLDTLGQLFAFQSLDTQENYNEETTADGGFATQIVDSSEAGLPDVISVDAPSPSMPQTFGTTGDNTFVRDDVGSNDPFLDVDIQIP